ncbi:winged helix-turn-helix transcriptional regulator [Desulfitobacterium chlororespirans]|uniref:Transcriptional regulator, HxlR family n=1 Tax=Desulfitobacterium chlororespirans DSM 11544 TaxID=1121395 RepID=A0A1M7S072_9FIRM|nr:helix-turn-helix domain-containing protein [Desulfitobacterium chlororespirans]SHN51979.1 transcriptional regulator, HxlR family [Desulfitobacterium chlororespirans DSM 11544]
MKYEPKIEKEIMCPIEYGLDVFGGKWKARILCVLSTNTVIRYNAIRKELGNITDAVLAAMLKELIADELIERTQYNEIPPKVEYALTDKGRSVLPILQNICQWSRQQTKDELEKKLPPCKTCDQLKK